MKPIAIDLGLSVIWADRVLGSEDIPFQGSNVKASGSHKTKREESDAINCFIRQTLGGRWRLPTLQEVKDLLNKCSVFDITYYRYLNESDPQDSSRRKSIPFSVFKVVGPNGRYIIVPKGFLLLESRSFDFPVSNHDGKCETAQLDGPAFWSFNEGSIYIPYCNDIQNGCLYNYPSYKKDIIPYKDYYGVDAKGVLILPVTDLQPTGRDKFLRVLEQPLNLDCYMETNSKQRKNYDVKAVFEISNDAKKKRQEVYEAYVEEVARAEASRRQQVETESRSERTTVSQPSQSGPVKRSLPRNKHETGSVVNWETSRIPRREDVGRYGGTAYGQLILENRHVYDIEYTFNAYYPEDSYWRGRGRFCCTRSSSIQEVARDIEQQDFKFCRDYYEAYGRFPM